MTEGTNGNAAQALRAAARRKIYRELKFSEFEPSLEGAVRVRVNLTHAEANKLGEIGDALRGERERLELLPEASNGNKLTAEEEAERERLRGLIQADADKYLVFMASLAGLSEAEALAFFHSDNDDQDPTFEQWFVDSVSKMVREHRDEVFTKAKMPSGVGEIR